ncbi:hypothetical protein SODALDRAFT_354623 [Sodiomyces alkalinus F11]|uniref:Uncharacterized protein n=1 Tax=Sodiomyces alkalinus (strain CBS 110278 / VKM F-3762 / F11) TaxID=1314773 RepID=A0A3N2Q6Q0_SODAK|nr:hypothetical protein SODALDRAFT_354623 [Sodiomyces alkalinus F11]ROT42469.1 hypothetical protein SODALDRAFT_354623 [Sodiomyces alkalinus F11]
MDAGTEDRTNQSQPRRTPAQPQTIQVYSETVKVHNFVETTDRDPTYETKQLSPPTPPTNKVTHKIHRCGSSADIFPSHDQQDSDFFALSELVDLLPPSLSWLIFFTPFPKASLTHLGAYHLWTPTRLAQLPCLMEHLVSQLSSPWRLEELHILAEVSAVIAA